MANNCRHFHESVVTTILLAAWSLLWLRVHAVSGAHAVEKPRILQSGAGRSRFVLENGLNSSSRDADSLMQFRQSVWSDPNGVLEGWDAGRNPDVCSWRGVGCNSGRVSALNLAGQNLTGAISPFLGNLTFLDSLLLANNYFVGAVPSSLGSLTRLRRLDLSNNAFESDIPSQISNCSSLVSLILFSNRMSGIIPPELGSLRNLSELDLRNNGFVSFIPNSLGNCSSLELFRLGNNSLEGQPPPIFESMQLLKVLDLSNNPRFQWSTPPDTLLLNCSSLLFLNLSAAGLTGSMFPESSTFPSIATIDLSKNNLSTVLPYSLGNRSSLTHLDVSENSLIGPIPYVLGRLQSLEYLDLSYNSFSGLIPPLLVNCSSLSYFAVIENNLTGAIPDALGQLSKLTHLLLAVNSLSGPIPKSLVNCTMLQEINFYTNQLTGEIFPNIGLLRNLTRVRFDVNKLGGPIPSSFGNLSSLDRLGLGEDPFEHFALSPHTGPIPSEIGKLHNLEVFYLSRTNVTGGIPPWIGNLLKLRRLVITGNSHLGGSIPPETGNLTKLITLGFAENHHLGGIPGTLGRLSKLGKLYLNYNVLTGPIPIELTNLTSAVNIQLGNNRLSGRLIPEIGSLVKVQDLVLRKNNLTGEVPASLGNCSQLLRLSLQKNKFSGPISRELWTGLRTIYVMDLSRNKLSGVISPEIGLLTNIIEMNLSFNSFEGSIPSEIQECKDLSLLDLSNNRLTGELPVAALQQLRHLEEFSVVNNSLEGNVPDSVGSFANVTGDAYAGNPGLCGALLGRNCSASSAIPKQACHGISCHRKWIYVVVGIVGFLIGVVIILGMICACSASTRDCWTHIITNKVASSKDVDIPYVCLYTKELNVRINDLWSGTGFLSHINIIGAGGHGTVFKAVLPGKDRMVIAVKCLKLEPKDSDYGMHDLYHELKFLGNLRHRNLVKLHGFYTTSSVKALLMEFVPNGSLHSHLHPGVGEQRRGCMLSFNTRLEIAIGVADAMAYLHHECTRPVIHRDLTPSNILLDPDFTAKVADFGIAKHVHNASGKYIDQDVTATALRGTMGYIAPEYATSNKVSTKGDVYSYGVILLEMLTGRRPTDEVFAKEGTWLAEWVQQSIADGDRLLSILDHTLQSEFAANETQIRMLVRVGLLCTHERPRERPSMDDVRQLLAQVNNPANNDGVRSTHPSVEELVHMPGFPDFGLIRALDARLDGFIRSGAIDGSRTIA